MEDGRRARDHGRSHCPVCGRALEAGRLRVVLPTRTLAFDRVECARAFLEEPEVEGLPPERALARLEELAAELLMARTGLAVERRRRAELEQQVAELEKAGRDSERSAEG